MAMDYPEVPKKGLSLGLEATRQELEKDYDK
ncbi:MAG: hypothetical protein FOGNACKC_00351 [Anaerolineae bacterium]|nr:hypothetical protein [Anaerolineae bacterium]